MVKQKRKLTAAEKAEKKNRREQYMTIFINGKQKRVKRPTTIDGMSVDESIRRNADPIWLHQNEMWEYMETETESDTGDVEDWDVSFNPIERQMPTTHSRFAGRVERVLIFQYF